MGAQHLFAHLHLSDGEEIRVFGELDDDGAGQLGEIACGADLVVVGQPMRVGEMRLRHVEPLGGIVHALNKDLLAAAHSLGDHHGDIVGRFDDEHLERGVECDRLALFQP